MAEIVKDFGVWIDRNAGLIKAAEKFFGKRRVFYCWLSVPYHSPPPPHALIQRRYLAHKKPLNLRS